MKRLIQFFSVVVIALVSTAVMAQDTPPVASISDFNDYSHLEGDLTLADIPNHPMVDSTVTYTAVIVSYPGSSGLAGFDEDANGNVTSIDRIHVFVTDTAAVTQGRAGMSIQIVESDYELLSGYTRGDVVTFVGRLTFWNSTAQMTVDEPGTRLGNVREDASLAKYAPLLDPWEVSIADLNTLYPDNTHEVNIANYPTYNGAYVKLTNAVVSNASIGTRPDWAVNNDGSRIYIYDTSLRYRNDQTNYISTFNFRRSPDPEFIPPAPGATINLSGFVVLNNDNPDGNRVSGSEAFNINPFEDGVVWLNGNRFVDGDDLGGGVILDWPNDIEVIGSPPLFSNVTRDPVAPTPDDAVNISANVVPGTEGTTVTDVSFFYIIDGDTTSPDLTVDGDVYSTTIPAQALNTGVDYYFEATDSDGAEVRNPLTGTYSYVSIFTISSIAEIQTTADGNAGDSPFAGAGALEADITATVTSSAVDHGDYITIQDDSAPWSGVFVVPAGDLTTLVYGDLINITEVEVSESFGLTQVTINAYNKVGTNDMVDDLVVSANTDSVMANFEAYEGVLLNFQDVTVATNQADGTSDFGEWAFTTAGGTSALRYDDFSDTFPTEYNEFFKIGSAIESVTGVLYYSFNNPKLVGSPSDVIGEDYTSPFTYFDLIAPDAGSEVEVTGEVAPSWEPTFDIDGNEVSYEWVLYGADSTEVVAVPSNNEGADTTVTLSFATVDGLLDGAGLAVGESADFLWNVRVISGMDTSDVANGYDATTNTFSPLYRNITLTRGVETSIEDISAPTKFTLEQNYPNPFNPSTNIEFALPSAQKVTLKVFDMLGREVATLIDGQQMSASSHSIRFDASALASGMYIYRIEAGAFSSTRKMMLIK